MPRIFAQQLFPAFALCLVLTACQSIGNRSLETHTQFSQQHPAKCLAAIRSFRDEVAANDVRNAGTPALSFYPLLHSNRFLTKLSHSIESEVELQQWSTLLAELAIETRASENRNLSEPWSNATLEELADCSRSLAVDTDFTQTRETVLWSVQQSVFPDHYLPVRQALGALPLLRPFLKQRIQILHGNEQRWFSEEETFAQSNFYELKPISNIAANTRSSKSLSADWMRAGYASNDLELPLLTEQQLDALFREHAPGLHVESAAENDKIGAPTWQDGEITIDTDSALVTTLSSFTQFEGRNLLQLNYVFWFPERRPEAFIDLYAGKIDSIIWRVTLAKDGRVLLYDSIHSCGCYHKYFTVAEKLLTKSQPTSREPANIFRLEKPTLSDGIVLTITANEHYIVGIDSASANEEQNRSREKTDYALSPYALLNNVKSMSGTRSLFDTKGLLAGSGRLERFTLWPTGILSVGAMRQWGTHATGFIEEQHFDDATLFENYFETVSTLQH